ncbi:thiamine pyrophosphate-binding protein [Oceanibacterium hippocampi]|uniref:Acetolactate synthase large subunit IlvB1 n=1 Tax=Oceanibacterium hippocampi TaxID=745714 RepID=A0A1Y5TRR2_9PROT|nr:thiamine pyrophosphate-binding protein [Oceanibacterium hippocampi]SLN66678.1 Acetolactate synthase large subunit IlvB1 [Oceanibacterium hippocampi]
MTQNVGPWRAVVEALKSEGVRYVFGLPGNPKHLVYDLTEHSDIRFVLVRDEKSAVACAYAWGRLTGEPGVVFSNPGPGITNLVTGLLEATSGSVPVVAISNGVVQIHDGMGAFQELDSRTLMMPVTKWSNRISDIKRVPWVMQRAFTVARNGRPGATFVEIPSDLAGTSAEMPDYVPSVPRQRSRPEENAAKAAADLIAAAQRPTILCGGGAIVAGAYDEVARLADRIGAAVLTTPSGRGIYPEDGPLSLGQVGLYFSTAGKAWYDNSDLVIVVGSRLEAFSTNNWSFQAKSARLIRIDTDPEALSLNSRADVDLVGDAALALQDIEAALNATDYPAQKERVQEIAGIGRAFTEKARAEARTPSQPIRPPQLLDAVNRIFGHDTILMKENGAADLWCYYWPYYQVLDTGDCVAMGEQTAMGMGAIGAIGAKLARPDKQVVCFIGDGAMQMAMVEMATAAENRCGVTWVVLNNQSFGWVQYNQVLTGRPRIGTGFDQATDLAAVARAQGCHGIRLEAPDKVDEAIAEARSLNARGIPVLIDAQIARHDYYKDFVDIHRASIASGELID